MKFKQYLLIPLTIILSLNFVRGDEFIQPGYYYILTQPLPVNHNKINSLNQPCEMCFIDTNQQQQQQLYQQLIPNTPPKEAIIPELFLTENRKNIQEIQVPNQENEIQNQPPQIYTQSGINEPKIINEFTNSNQTESVTDSGSIFVSPNAPLINDSKVDDLHKVIIRNTNDNPDFQKNKKTFDIVFSQEVLQQMARDLVNTFINKIPGGVKNFNFTQYAEEVEKIIKTYLPYGILSVANGEISNFVQNVLPQLNGQSLQNLINNPNLVNNYATTRNNFDSLGAFFNYVLKNGGPGLTQSENARNYNSLYMNNNGQPYVNNNYGQPENQNYNSQFRNFNFQPPVNNNNNNNNGLSDIRNFPPLNNNNNNNNNFPQPLNNRNFNIPPGQNFNLPFNNGQVDGRNFNPPLFNNNNNRQLEYQNFNSQQSTNNNGQPVFRNYDSPSSTSNNVQKSGEQNSNFPFTNNNNVQRRMVINPNNYKFKVLNTNFKNYFT